MADASPRWWLVIGSLRSGGTERQVVALANGLSLRGESVAVAVIDGRHPSAYELDARVRVETLGHGGASGALLAIVRLRRLVSNDAVVYAFLDAANLIATLATVGRRRWLVWGVRASDIGPSAVARLTSRLCRPLSRHADVLIGNAAACIAFYRRLGFSPKAHAVVPNGIDVTTWRPDSQTRSSVRRELGIDETIPVVGFVARVDPQKRHDLMLDAFARITRAHLVLVGRGTNDPDGVVIGKVRELGISDRVSVLGERQDLPRLTASFDIACCASYYEGFPNSLLEGMACGACCVGSDVGGIRDVLDDVGMVVSEPTVDAFAACLAELIADAPRRIALAAAGRHRAVACYSIDAMVDGTIAAVGRTRGCGSDAAD
jgi:glycosyltransferase involved in cell wall biosynthesis